MAHARFHAMRLNFQELIVIMRNPDFTRLIFQPILDDVSKSKDDYILTCYEEYSDEEYPTLTNIEFVKSNKKVYDAVKKVMFGNLPLKRDIIQTFINDTPDAQYMYFLPTKYGEYAQYVLNTDIVKEPLATYELKPAPPAS